MIYYSKAEDEWLIENFDGGYTDEYIENFCAKFRKVTRCGLFQHCSKQLHLKPTYCIKKGKVTTFFSDDEIAWIKENYMNHSSSLLIKMFKEKFGRRVNRNNLSDIATKRFGLKKSAAAGSQGRFTPYGVEGNKRPSAPVGTERFFDGYVFVKIADCHDAGADNFKRNWIQKQRYVWEQHNGAKVPKGHIVIFLDGDKKNFSPDNLYLVSRSVHAVMCKNDWYKPDREFTLTALLAAQLSVEVNKAKSTV